MFKPSTVAVAVAAILGSTLARLDCAQAQEATASDADDNTTDTPLEEVVVKGLRRSLEQSMDIKRDSVGVVDAITAEDIGKFPDTNLSEALQRITGISINRRNGEGALVTARGFGSQYNMVTLNGRQMPAADAYGNGDAVSGGVAGNNRSFNFANLAAEAISGIEVYKTSRATIATGGIGATINIKTARPFDNSGVIANVGVKAVNDTTNRVGDDFTPEVSGIFSFTDDDRRWGVGLNGSFQKRDSGSSMSTVNDWHIQAWDADMAVNRNQAPLSPTANIVNAPAVGQLYGIPNDIRYHFADRERERTNAQLTVQFAPMDSVTLTADYTYALTSLKEDRGDQTIWLQRNGFTNIEFDTGSTVATPVMLSENTGASKDFGYEQQHREQQNDLKSVGFNANWELTDRFSLAFDVHDSQATSMPDDPITGGGETTFSLAGKVPSTGNCSAVCSNFWTQTFQFNGGLPVAARTLYPTNTDALAGRNGNNNFTFDANSIGSQVLRINYQDQDTEIRQARLDGALKFDNGRFQFGVETRTMDMRQRASGGTLVMGDWGATDTGLVPDMVAMLQPFSLVNSFHDFNPSGAPTGGLKGSANALGQWALAHGYTNWSEVTAIDGQLVYNPGFNTDNQIGEDSDALYIQFAMQGELGNMPANVVLGARYERTDVTSISANRIPTALLWTDDNDFTVQRPEEVTNLSEKAKYNNLLPSLDFDLAFTEQIKGRMSYSKSIARASYGNLAVGANPGGPGGSTLSGFQPPGTSNNPALQPLESDNVDLSLEYYFSRKGYVGVTFWDKRVNNFIGNSVTDQSLYGIRDQTSGPRAQFARDFLVQNELATDDSALFTLMAMIDNPGTFTDAAGKTWTGGAANYDGSNAQHVAFATKYDLLPNDDDPLYQFAVSTPVNNRKARIYGWELGGQYFFGDTGFGVLANYTIVKGDVGYDNASDPNENQFALLGLSDSANAVLMYEKFGATVRLAYNWRDESLSNINVGQWRNPIYVEAYDQVDLSIGYDFSEHFAMSFEAINLTQNDIRWHGRSDNQLWYLEDQGVRFGLGARYRF